MPDDTGRETLIAAIIIGLITSYVVLLGIITAMRGQGMVQNLINILIIALCTTLGAYMVVFKWDMSAGWSTYAPIGFFLMLGIPIFLVTRLYTEDTIQLCIWPFLFFFIGFYATAKIVKDDIVAEFRSNAPARRRRRIKKKALKDQKKEAKQKVREAKRKVKEEKKVQKKKERKEKEGGVEAKASDGSTKEGGKAEDGGKGPRGGFMAWLNEEGRKDDGSLEKDSKTEPKIKKARPQKGALSKFSSWLNEEDKTK